MSGLKPSNIPDDEAEPYVMTNEIGKGSFAVVYRGFHKKTKQLVAIKTVSRAILTSKLLDNLTSEINILKAISHPHITELKEIVKAEKTIYLVMEFCSGGDLSNYLRMRGKVETLQFSPSPGAPPIYYPHPKSGGLDHKVVKSFLAQLADALKFLRERNLIHRDIKPQNLLLQPPTAQEYAAGHPLGIPILKVADFGFARSLPNASMAETLCGSPLYMAPEILRYEKYDAKCDLWSVGAVLYEISVGKPPYRAQNHMELIKRIERARNHVSFPKAEEGVGDVEEGVKKLIRALLKKNAVERLGFEEFFNHEAVTEKYVEPTRVQDLVKEAIAEPEAAPAPVVPTQPVNTFRRRKDVAQVEAARLASGSGIERNPLVGKDAGPSEIPYGQTPRSQDLEQSDPDGILKRDYVVVDDTRAIEFNRVADEIEARKRSKRDHPNTFNTFPRRARTSPPLAVTNDANTNFTAVTAPHPSTPPFATTPRRPTIQTSATTPNMETNMTFPPSPSQSPFPPLIPHAQPSPPSNALVRAINVASKKLFGSPSPTQGSNPTKKDKFRERDWVGTPKEEELLNNLEDLAKKARVLMDWSDVKFKKVEAVPSKPISDPSQFAPKKGEASSKADARRRKEMEAEHNAVHCIALYMAVMTFSQRAIDTIRKWFVENGEDGGVWEGGSERIDDALQWFRDTFNKCLEKAEVMKTWLPRGHNRPHMWIDRVIYDHALALIKKAAKNEVIEENLVQCEKDYETALWMLHAITDDVFQEDNQFRDQDTVTINSFIGKTKTSLSRLRRRMEERADNKENNNPDVDPSTVPIPPTPVLEV